MDAVVHDIDGTRRSFLPTRNFHTMLLIVAVSMVLATVATLALHWSYHQRNSKRQHKNELKRTDILARPRYACQNSHQKHLTNVLREQHEEPVPPGFGLLDWGIENEPILHIQDDYFWSLGHPGRLRQRRSPPRRQELSCGNQLLTWIP